jgi:hypothetical protein
MTKLSESGSAETVSLLFSEPALNALQSIHLLLEEPFVGLTDPILELDSQIFFYHL